MNSFSGVRRAAEYEIARQIEVLKKGGQLMQETRRWDDDAGITDSMRTKEDAHDYRYFPDPDLMPHRPSKEWLAAIREGGGAAARPQAPFMEQYELPAGDADVFVGDAALGIILRKSRKD